MTSRHKAEPILPDAPMPGTLMPRDQQVRMVSGRIGKTLTPIPGRPHYSD